MTPRAIEVKPPEDYSLLLTFENGEQRVFDVKPYIKGSWFGQLKNPEIFNAVRIAGLSVEWRNGQDLCPNCLYEDSVLVQ